MKLPKPILYILGGIMVLVVIITILILIASFFKIPDTGSNFQKAHPSAISANQELGFSGNSSHIVNVEPQGTIFYPIEVSVYS